MELLFIAQAQQEPNFVGMLIPFILMFVLFWVLIIRPQKKRQQEHQQLVESLKKGDKVVTAGGLHGIITNVKGAIITVRVDDNNNTRIDIERGSIERIVDRTEGDDDSKGGAPEVKKS
jgi:preprotein translocase subunit YajC